MGHNNFFIVGFEAQWFCVARKIWSATTAFGKKSATLKVPPPVRLDRPESSIIAKVLVRSSTAICLKQFNFDLVYPSSKF